MLYITVYYYGYIQILTDWKLIVIVLVITGVAVILLLIGEAVPYLRSNVVLVEDAEQKYGENVSIFFYCI